VLSEHNQAAVVCLHSEVLISLPPLPPSSLRRAYVVGLLARSGALRAVPSFELAISQAIYHSKWLLGRFLGLMKGIEGQATETAA
jgi:hypothetical protein